MNQILVVEADPVTLTLRADELLADGHEVNTANSAAAARVELATATRMILGHLDNAPETLALIRDLRGGQIPHAIPRSRSSRSAPTTTTSRSATTRRALTSPCPPRPHQR